MDASDPEVRRTLEDSLKDLAWMRGETKQRQTKLKSLFERLNIGHDAHKIDELEYQVERLKLTTSQEAIDDTLRMIQRQRALITSWIIDAEKKG